MLRKIVQEKPRKPCGDGRNNDQSQQSMIPEKQADPFLPETEKKSKQRASMQRDIKGKCINLAAPVEKPWKQYKMCRAANRQEFRQSLDYT